MAIRLLEHADAVRREIAPEIALKRKSELGQFMTPAAVARFMASLFPPSTLQTCRLLDAGAGVGSLSCAFLDRWTSGQGFSFQNVEVHAYEIDDVLQRHLESTLASYAVRLPLQYHVSLNDFIHEAALQSLRDSGRFTHAILNPPYKKINSKSEHRLILRRMGIETVNSYSPTVRIRVGLSHSGPSHPPHAFGTGRHPEHTYAVQRFRHPVAL